MIKDNKQKGILVSSLLKDEHKGTILVVKKFSVFDQTKIKDYIERFNNLKDKGIFLNKSFSDNIWILKYDEDGYKRNHNLKFNLEAFSKVNISLKFYCLEILTNKVSYAYCYTQITNIIKAIIESNFFNPINFEDFQDYIYSLSEGLQDTLREQIIRYIAFWGEEINENYISFLNSIDKSEKKSRLLPDYKSILRFNFYMNKFIEEENGDLKIKYYPIILWWVITSVIPMRPLEFTRIQKEDCYIKDKKNYIEVTRSKQNSYLDKALNRKRKQIFRITDKVYSMINEYIYQKGHKGKYILSYELLNSLSGESGMYSDYELIPTDRLIKVLNNFYKEVILEKYGVSSVHKYEVKDTENKSILKINEDTIVKLQLGDTRHLAIINLVLQGYNPLTIKNLSGHRDINTHLHYYSHIEQFIESKTLVLADSIRSELSRIDNGYFPLIERSNKRLDKLINSKNIESEDVIKIADGKCFFYLGRMDMFPDLCVTRCSTCRHHIKNTDNLGSDGIEKKIQDIKSNIDLQVEIIKHYTVDSLNNRFFDRKSGKINNESKKKLKTSSNKLEALINEKAQMEAYKMKLNEI